MPRPKVKPQDRQRSVRACAPCKRSKIRCDGTLPCTTCKRRARDSACVYETWDSPRARRPSQTSHSADHQAPVAIDIPGAASRPQYDASSASFDAITPQQTDDDEESPQSRSLLTSRMQKVYIGETASLSYLQFLRHILKHRVGPCAFTENEFSNYMLETEVSANGTETLNDLDMFHRQALVQSYLEATSGLLDLYDSSDINNAIEQTSRVNCNVPPAALYLVLAIGAQCRGTQPSDLGHAATFFAKGRAMSFESMLSDPSPDMVAQFLLMAFYMLGACHRNAAFMYLGVASKAASALGLQRVNQYRDLSSPECRLRLNAWKSLRVLDMIVNSILGRYSGPASSKHEERSLNKLCETVGGLDTMRQVALQATFGICPFMDELEKFGSNQSVAFAENFLQRLQKWSKALPLELRQGTETSPGAIRPADLELYIGATHVACVYYFAVMLTTRRFLTMFLLPKVKKQANPNASSPPKTTEQEATIGLAHVCLNAAVNLAKACYKTISLERKPNNLCIVKAWVFAAGLVLGFSLFAQSNEPNAETEAAFLEAQAVLNHLAALSPQAKHYSDILATFYQAINMHQRRCAEERRRLTSRYMDQLFTFGGDGGHSTEMAASSLASNSTQSSLMPMDGLGQFNEANYNFADGNMSTGLDTMSRDFMFPVDDMSFDWQAFAPFFDDVF